ncbi:MAG: hypothetical protein ACKOXP_04490, partial [Flavobacteriales bacterium]
QTSTESSNENGTNSNRVNAIQSSNGQGSNLAQTGTASSNENETNSIGVNATQSSNGQGSNLAQSGTESSNENGTNSTGVNATQTTDVPEIITIDLTSNPEIQLLEQEKERVQQDNRSNLTSKERLERLQMLEQELLTAKRQLMVEESFQVIEDAYPSVVVIRKSYEMQKEQSEKLRIQEIQQALSFESNVEQKTLLEKELKQLIAAQKQHQDHYTMEHPQVRDLNTESLPAIEPTNVSELQRNPSYLNYAQERVSLQEKAQEFNQIRTERILLADSLQRYMTESTSISSINLKRLAARHEELIQQEEALITDIEQRQLTLRNVENQSAFEWMLNNGILAERQENANGQFVSSTGTTTTLPFSVESVATMNQVFPAHPINVPLPQGLIFRVQVGAFRKPVPNQLFREFGPVSGEVLTNGLTCYLAGYFNGTADALEARTMIRRLGYADAFIVAYCDGKRYSYNEGRAMEVNGTCRKQSKEELQFALNQLLQQNQVQNATEISRNPVASTTVDPNSTEANLDLYYTVQVAVYNKKLTSDNINGVKELLVTKTDKGQYRYSSGEFVSFAEARQRKNEVIAKGIPDAYVVAYYRGKRISIGEANQLLASGITPKKRGDVELVSTSSNVAAVVNVPIETPVLKPLVKRDSIVQFELKVDEDTYLSQLTRLNRVGTFTYQADKNRIVSPKYALENMSVNQQLYLSDMKRMREKPTKMAIQAYVIHPMQLDFYDWLLHQSVSYDVQKENDEYIFRFYPENDDQKEGIDAAAKQFKWKLKE